MTTKYLATLVSGWRRFYWTSLLSFLVLVLSAKVNRTVNQKRKPWNFCKNSCGCSKGVFFLYMSAILRRNLVPRMQDFWIFYMSGKGHSREQERDVVKTCRFSGEHQRLSTTFIPQLVYTWGRSLHSQENGKFGRCPGFKKRDGPLLLLYNLKLSWLKTTASKYL